MKKKDYKCIFITIFLISILAVIFSLKINAKPNYNGDESGCGDYGCHIYEENDNGQHISIITNQISEETTEINITLKNGNQKNSTNLEFRWNHNTKTWDGQSINSIIELTENEPEGTTQIIKNEKEGFAPNFTIKAPKKGRWKVYAGYLNGTEDEDNFTCYYTWSVIDVKYENFKPVANASFKKIKRGKFIKYLDNYIKYIYIEFDKNGFAEIQFDAENSTDPNIAQGDNKNLTFYWDFYEIDGTENNSFSISSKYPKTDVNFTFQLKSGGGYFDVNKKYDIKLSITDSHLENAWDIDWFFVKFKEPIELPDLVIYEARFNPQDDNEDSYFSIGEKLYLEIKFKNIGKNSTGEKDFIFKIYADEIYLFKIIYSDELEANITDKIIYPWISSEWSNDYEPIYDHAYNCTILIDSRDDILEGPLPWAEENNTFIKKNAFEFDDFGPPPPKLIIETLTYEPKELIQDTDLFINITMKNNGNGTTKVFTIEIWWMSAAGITNKVKLKTFQRRDLEAGVSEIIEHVHLPQLTTTDETKDEHQYLITLIYRGEMIDDKKFTIVVLPDDSYNSPILRDLSVYSRYIEFSNNKPKENEIIKITVKIKNRGIEDIEDVKINFYCDDEYIGSNTIDIIYNESFRETSLSWKVKTGEHKIWVKIDEKNVINEFNEDNNVAYKKIPFEENEFNLNNFIGIFIFITIFLCGFIIILMRKKFK